MKRTALIAAASAGLLAASATGIASAATVTTYKTVTKTRLQHETKTVYARAACKLSLATVAPAGEPTVTPGSPSGTQYGHTFCDKLKAGVTQDVFTTDAAGDISGTIQHWFRGGTIYGKFSLTEALPSGPPTASSFASADYAGTVTISTGQGLLSHTAGTGSLKCATPDGTHFDCTETLHLHQQVSVIVPVKYQVREKVVRHVATKTATTKTAA